MIVLTENNDNNSDSNIDQLKQNENVWSSPQRTTPLAVFSQTTTQKYFPLIPHFSDYVPIYRSICSNTRTLNVHTER